MSLQQSQNQSDLVNEFIRTGAAQCPSCQYQLHKLEVDRCPECGNKLKLQIAIDDVGRDLRMMGLFGTAALSLLLLPFTIFKMIEISSQFEPIWGGSDPDLLVWSQLFILLIWNSLAFGAAGWFFGARQQFEQLSVEHRRVVAVAGLCSPLSIVLLMLMLFWLTV